MFGQLVFNKVVAGNSEHDARTIHSKSKIAQVRLCQVKCFFPTKGTHNRRKRYSTEYEEIVTNNISEKY